jgi:hypothetical protein
MGIISTAIVVMSSERCKRPKTAQPGNREWVTVIQGINSQGWAIPPFVIFKGQHHLSTWYSEDVPNDWVLATSENGWTTNELGFQWIQHFERHTKQRTTGTHRLLILDGHKSHHSTQFERFCEDNNIITLCMPPHSSHLLQPLDVGCFGPLKKAYGWQIESLMRTHINHITKLEFLPVFKAAFDETITKPNIRGSFRGTGLVPYNPENVLCHLDLKLRTPTPPAPETTPWESKTPQNPVELAFQMELVKGRVAKHQNSSPTPINDALDQLFKGAQTMMHSAVLLKAEVEGLQKANQAKNQRRKQQRKQIQQGGVLTVQEGQDILTQSAIEEQISQEIRQETGPHQRIEMKQRRCGTCGETGHNVRTCQKG